MINATTRSYNYYKYGAKNEYGQLQLSKEPQGNIKMAIYNTSQTAQGNILYQDASYIGLTSDAEVNDTYVIEYGKERLKVLYIQTRGIWKQVFMARM